MRFYFIVSGLFVQSHGMHKWDNQNWQYGIFQFWRNIYGSLLIMTASINAYTGEDCWQLCHRPLSQHSLTTENIQQTHPQRLHC